MKARRTLLYICICLSVVFCSCRDKREGEDGLAASIERTWQLCEVSLHEAQVQTDALRDSVRTSSECVRQRYDLLTIRLRDKNDIVPSSPDSALRTATYFDVGGSGIDRERAQYYLGSAYRDLKDYPRAVVCFLKAVDVAGQSREADTLIWQNALSQLRSLYMLQLNYEEELKVALRAVELADEFGGSGRNRGWYLMDVASAYEHLNDTLHCLLYLDLSYKAIREEGFPPKYGSTLSYMLLKYSDYGQPEKAEPLLRRLAEMPEESRPVNYELCLARYCENGHDTDRAIDHYTTYYRMAQSLAGRYEAAAGLQRCYLRRGDFRNAALWGQYLSETTDSIVARRAFEQTQRARNEYLYLRDREAEQAVRLRDERIVFASVIAALALLCLTVGMVALYFYRKKRYVEEIANWKSLLEEKAQINRELTRFAMLNDATKKAEGVVEHFREVADGKAVLSPNAWMELTAAMETLYPGLLEKVRARLHGKMHEPLLQTICLVKIGLRPAEIARLMGAPIQTVWNRVKRAQAVCGDLIAL